MLFESSTMAGLDPMGANDDKIRMTEILEVVGVPPRQQLLWGTVATTTRDEDRYRWPEPLPVSVKAASQNS